MNARLYAYLIARLNEGSTWRSLILIASSTGTMVSPEHAEAIIAGGLLVAGALGATLPDSITKDKP